MKSGHDLRLFILVLWNHLDGNFIMYLGVRVVIIKQAGEVEVGVSRPTG